MLVLANGGGEELGSCAVRGAACARARKESQKKRKCARARYHLAPEPAAPENNNCAIVFSLINYSSQPAGPEKGILVIFKQIHVFCMSKPEIFRRRFAPQNEMNPGKIICHNHFIDYYSIDYFRDSWPAPENK